MSVFCKILTGLLWVIVICSLVFTAFQFSWFADAGVWVAKDAFDAEITQAQFLDGVLFFIMGAVPVLLIATIFECVFLHKQDEGVVVKEKKQRKPKKENNVVPEIPAEEVKDIKTEENRATVMRNFYYR